jgi:hypothetical protein
MMAVPAFALVTGTLQAGLASKVDVLINEMHSVESHADRLIHGADLKCRAGQWCRNSAINLSGGFTIRR